MSRSNRSTSRLRPDDRLFCLISRCLAFSLFLNLFLSPFRLFESAFLLSYLVEVYITKRDFDQYRTDQVSILVVATDKLAYIEILHAMNIFDLLETSDTYLKLGRSIEEAEYIILRTVNIDNASRNN